MSAVVGKWGNSESDRRRRSATVATDDSEAVARNERLTDESSAFILAMNEDDVCPAFNADNHVFGNF